MNYVGDLSRQDVQILATYAATANRIVEFGAGASTQVFADNSPHDASVICVETNREWVRSTKDHLQHIDRSESKVFFREYQEFQVYSRSNRRIDLAFCDGINDLRQDFALRAWPMLRIGGVLLVHDTRHLKHVETVLSVIRAYHLEVDAIRFNERASNVTAIVKKFPEPYVNWNEVEKLSRGALAAFSNADGLKS